jgi:hypothetical protein
LLRFENAIFGQNRSKHFKKIAFRVSSLMTQQGDFKEKSCLETGEDNA